MNTNKKMGKKRGRPRKDNTKTVYVKNAIENGVSKKWANTAYKLKQMLNNQ